MTVIFEDGRCLVVTTRGKGSLHLFTYDSTLTSDNVVGSTPTTNTGVTRFLVSFSHTYKRYAFFWDGAGEAVYGFGTSLQRKPVGTSWNHASEALRGASTITTTNVSLIVVKASKRNSTTCYIIPDQI